LGSVQLQKLEADDAADHCPGWGADQETHEAWIIAFAPVAFDCCPEKTARKETPDGADHSAGHFATD
jgi:hypothetical protein